MPRRAMGLRAHHGDRQIMSDQVLVTAAEYARRRKVTPAAVSKWIKAGRFPTYQQGDKRLIDVAEADLALDRSVERIMTPVVEAPTPQTGELTAARTEGERIRTRMLRLAYAQKRNELLPRKGVIEAAKRCGGTLVMAIDRLTSNSDEIFSIARAGDVGAVRMKLRAMARELREAAAEAFAKLASDAIAANDAAVDDQLDDDGSDVDDGGDQVGDQAAL